MGNRLSSIVTRTGDTGTTGLGDGSRVAKDSERIEAIGTVDELNSAIGLLAALPGLSGDVGKLLLTIQHDLFDLGGELAVPGHSALTASHVESLEQAVACRNATLPPLKEFILPGGSEAAARCHLARSIARRAERRCWTLAGSGKVNHLALVYLNRLSDLLFVLARTLARADGGNEILWDRNRLK
jgi:cob(I)alamin adenosyltransferase